jgi:hypothetical protein
MPKLSWQKRLAITLCTAAHEYDMTDLAEAMKVAKIVMKDFVPRKIYQSAMDTIARMERKERAKNGE